MMPIEREIRDLAAGLQGVKDEQEYLVIRERVHRNSKLANTICRLRIPQNIAQSLPLSISFL